MLSGWARSSASTRWAEKGSPLRPGGTRDIGQWRKPPVPHDKRPKPRRGCARKGSDVRGRALSALPPLCSAPPGLLFFLVSTGGLRHRLISAVPPGLKRGTQLSSPVYHSTQISWVQGSSGNKRCSAIERRAATRRCTPKQKGMAGCQKASCHPWIDCGIASRWFASN